MSKVFLFLFFLVSLLQAADECGTSDYDQIVLDASSTSYENLNGNLRGRNPSDTYHITAGVAGVVTVTLTGTNVFYSYSESACPTTGGGLTSGTYIFAVPTDFNLRVYRPGGGRTSYTILVSFTPSANQPPDANDDNATTNQNTAVDIDVTSNDTDADGTIDKTTVVAQQGTNGTTTADPVTGVVTYTPNAGYFGTDTFTYTVKDNDGATSNIATVTVDINSLPVANDDNTSTNQNTAVDIDVTSNDTDADGTIDKTTVVAQQGANGTTTADPVTGVVTYTPIASFIGTDTFTYTVKDNDGATSNIATVTINVNCANMQVDDDKLQCPNACYTTIQGAVNAAVANDSISICPGTYSEAVQVIGKSGLTFTSSTSNSADVTVDSGTGNNNAFYINNSPSVKFDALTITAKQNAIQFFNSPGSFEISNSILSSSNDHTVFINGTPNNFKIIGNDFISAGNGFKSALQFQAGATTGEITDNNISIDNNNGYGIYIQSVPTNLSVTGNCFDFIGSEEAFSFSTGGSPLAWDGNYWEDQDWYGVVDNTPLSSCTLNLTAVPIVDYHFDECLWDGTADEVQDTSANGFHGRSLNGADTVSEAQLERSGYFDGIDDYVEQGDFYDTLKTTASLSFWIKTTQASPFANAQRSPGVTGIEDNGGTDDIFWGWIDDTGRIGVQKGNNLGPKSLLPINDDTWHHIVLTRDKDTQVCNVYVDGVFNETDTSAPGIVGNSFNRIGSVMDTDGTHTYFNGHLDEVKAYATVISATEVQDIFNNESAGKNYDGIARETPCCCRPANGNLIGNPSFENLCQSNILTTFSNVEGGTVHLRDGLCGWSITDKIETWENTVNKPASDGTIFVEIDGDSGVQDAIWQELDTVDGEEYIVLFDYKARSSSLQDDIYVKWNGSLELHITDAQALTSEWKEGSVRVFGTAAKDTLLFEEQSADDGYGSWIDNIRVCLPNDSVCTGIVTNPDPASTFDVWDTFRDIDDRNISTKISGQAFILTLAALNETNDNYQEFNGTVCTQVFDRNTNTAQTLWSKSLFDEQNATTVTFDIGSSIKDAGITIFWKKDADPALACTAILGSEDNSTVASDNFSVRPYSFYIDANSLAVAGEDINISFIAGVNVSSGSVDYNETEGSSFDVAINEREPLCLTGIFTPALSVVSFEDGNFSTTTQYSEVGVLDVNITEKSQCQSRYAGVDCDDRNVTGSWSTDTNLSISPASLAISFIPDHFSVELVQNDFNYGTFTYLSADLNMSSFVDINITAKNALNATTSNYNTGCYAKNHDLNLTYSSVDSKLTNFLSYYKDSTGTILVPPSPVNTQVTYSLDKTTFTTDSNGSSFTQLFFNFDRNQSVVIEPFELNVTELSTRDEDAVSGTGSNGGSSSLFYYGRLHPSDLITTVFPANTLIAYEVYDNTNSSYIQGMKQTSLFWYINNLHNSSDEGNITEATASSNTVINPALSGFSFMYNSPLSGEENLSINAASTSKATIHLKTQTWLWYVPSSFGFAYDDGAGSDCTAHPCLKFSLLSDTGALKVQSGDFNGTVIPDANRSDYTRKGVKLFR